MASERQQQAYAAKAGSTSAELAGLCRRASRLREKDGTVPADLLRQIAHLRESSQALRHGQDGPRGGRLTG